MSRWDPDSQGRYQSSAKDQILDGSVVIVGISSLDSLANDRRPCVDVCFSPQECERRQSITSTHHCLPAFNVDLQTSSDPGTADCQRTRS